MRSGDAVSTSRYASVGPWRWFLRRPLLAAAALGILIIAGLAIFTDMLDRTLLRLRLTANKSLALTSQTARGEASRRLVRTAWKRMHWARVYVYRNGADAPPADLEMSWLKYNEATEEWNTELMVNIKALADYYPGTGKREQFEQEIQNLWRGISNQLFNLRYRTPKDPAAKKQLTEDIIARIDILNNVLYEFTLNQSSPKDR